MGVIGHGSGSGWLTEMDSNLIASTVLRAIQLAEMDTVPGSFNSTLADHLVTDGKQDPFLMIKRDHPFVWVHLDYADEYFDAIAHEFETVRGKNLDDARSELDARKEQLRIMAGRLNN